MPRKSRSSQSSADAAEKARLHWQIKDGYVSPRSQLRIRKALLARFEEQSTTDRGSAWEVGVFVQEKVELLNKVLEELGEKVISIIVGERITVVTPHYSIESTSQVEALIQLIEWTLEEKMKR